MLLLAGTGIYIYRQRINTPDDLTVSLNEDSRVQINLSEGTRDSGLQYWIETLPENGWLKGTLPDVTYLPKKDHFGKDLFRYSISRNGGKRYSASVRLTIKGHNDVPSVKDMRVSLGEDSHFPFTLSASDPDSETLSIKILKPPLHGTLSGSLPNVVYTPNPDFSGQDHLIFEARDLLSSSLPGTVLFSVAPINDPPVVFGFSVTTYRGFRTPIVLKAEDPDNSTLSYEWLNGPRHGVLKMSGKNRVMYLPNAGYTGADLFAYRAFDGQHYSNVAEVTVDVHAFKGADRLTAQLKKLINKGGVAIGDRDTGGYIFQEGKYKPASILKLATALAALHYLGGDARFQTEFSVDPKNNLFIKGYADPLLTTSEWKKIGAELSSMGVFNKPVPQITLDDTAIEKGSDFSGRGKTINYYDAPLGALASNYNIVEVNIRPGSGVFPWKNKAPVTDMIRKRARGLPRGYQRFSVASEPEGGTQYTGELIRKIFQQFGLKNKSIIAIEPVPVTLDTLYIHDSSHDLKRVVETMLLDSSNFIANQLLLVMAIDKNGEPGRLGQGVKLLNRFLKKQIGLRISDFNIVEGSGLSHGNRISLEAMLDVLTRFKDQRELLPPLTKAKYLDLIQIGRRWNIRAKTGTMKGIASLAGFLQKKDGEWLPFVIMLEGKPTDRARVLQVICRFYSE